MLISTVLSSVAAFVADIYGVDQTQGPALNMSESGRLSGMYNMNPDLLLDRVSAGIAEVTYGDLTHSSQLPVSFQHNLMLSFIFAGCCSVLSLLSECINDVKM